MMRERDFMGLSFNQNHEDGCRDSGLTGTAGAHWPLPNNVSEIPHMSFRGAQEDKRQKIVLESFLSPRFMPVSTSDANDPRQKRPAIDAQSVHCPYEVKMYSVSNQGITVPMGNQFLKNRFTSVGQNFTVTTTNPQIFGGIPVTTSYPVPPSAGSVVGTTEPRINGNTSGSPSQMTIFYNGSVNVYNDITLEKAQAMMVLAQNGSSVRSNDAHSKAEAPSSKFPAEDGVSMYGSIHTALSSFPSPLSVSSRTGNRLVSGSTSPDDLVAAKTTGLPTAALSKAEPPKTAVKSFAATAVNHSGIPQARKASLARFLEKRKERVVNAAPYNLNKISPEGNKGDPIIVTH